MNALEYASVPELVAELEKRAMGLAVIVVTYSDEGQGRIALVTDRVKGDPFAILGYVESLHATAKAHYAAVVGRPL